MIGDALINVLVVTAQQRELGAGRKSHRIRLVEAAPARRQQHNGSARAECIDGFEERIRFHHHSGTATIWIVIHRAVTIVREITQVDDIVLHGTSRSGARRNAERERRREEIGEYRYDVYRQHVDRVAVTRDVSVMSLEQTGRHLDEHHARVEIDFAYDRWTIRH